MSSGERFFPGREAMHRMNFLYQAAEICQKVKSSDGGKLSLFYASQITSIGRKAQCRMDPQLKRTLCKGCGGLLVPGDTVTVRLIKKPDPSIVWVCLSCGTYKNFRSRPNYSIWSEKRESVVEKISLEPVSSESDKVNEIALEDSNKDFNKLNFCVIKK